MDKENLLILLIEDKPDHTELVIRAFQDHRVPNRIVHLPDGGAALDYLFRRGESADPDTCPGPHLILLDLRLPKIDGLEVLREIKESGDLRRIPVVVLTTSEAQADMGAAYSRYVNSYLVKPVDFDEFGQLMNDLGLYWLGWNRKPGCDPAGAGV